MQERTFTFEDCTVVVHIPENIQNTVQKATEKFLGEVKYEKKN